MNNKESSSVNNIENPLYAVAREPVPEKLAFVMKIPIYDGAGGPSTPESVEINKQVCIMEATSYILGYDKISYAPPCTSETIREIMIERNDHQKTGPRKRNALKDLIPDIINTAPTMWRKTNRSMVNPTYKLVTVNADPAYLAAERQRWEMIEPYDRKVGNLTIDAFASLIRDLVAVAKFTGSAPHPLDVQ